MVTLDNNAVTHNLPIRQECIHELSAEGTSPHTHYTSVFYNEDGTTDTYDGKVWTNYPAKQIVEDNPFTYSN